MQKVFIKIAICFTFMSSQIPAQSKIDNSAQERTIIDLMEEEKVPGVCLAIIDHGRIVSEQAFGFAKIDENVSLELDHGFNIGSISKTFTAWGIMKLVEARTLSLDDHISKHLKSWNLPKSTYDDRKVTIRNLLQHTAGLSVHGYPGYEPSEKLPTTNECLSGQDRRDEMVLLIMEPETEFKYSGGGYTILQLIIEEVSGQSFERFMEKEVFDPLGMKNTSFTISKKLLSSSANAYDEDGKAIELRRFTAKAAAGLHTTVGDMTKFALAHWGENEVVSQASIQRLTTGSVLSKENYGMAYMIMERFGAFTLHGHGGSNEGWESGFMLDIENQSGFIMLTNGSNGKTVVQKSLMNWAMERRAKMINEK